MGRNLFRLIIGAAFALCACQQTPPAKPTLPVGAKYVSMGSSYAAGPGIPTYVDNPPQPCTRSSGNYAHQLAQRLKLQLVDVS